MITSHTRWTNNTNMTNLWPFLFDVVFTSFFVVSFEFGVSNEKRTELKLFFYRVETLLLKVNVVFFSVLVGVSGEHYTKPVCMPFRCVRSTEILFFFRITLNFSVVCSHQAGTNFMTFVTPADESGWRWIAVTKFARNKHWWASKSNSSVGANTDDRWNALKFHETRTKIIIVHHRSSHQGIIKSFQQNFQRKIPSTNQSNKFWNIILFISFHLSYMHSLPQRRFASNENNDYGNEKT